ncbi:unnamed protein product, partial [Discosporangium mesarthrocarpum]
MGHRGSNNSGIHPSPHQVVLRVKRQRDEPPIECLLVAATEGHNVAAQELAGRRTKKRRSALLLSDAFAAMSTKEGIAANLTAPQASAQALEGKEGSQRLRYKRFRTTKVDAQSGTTVLSGDDSSVVLPAELQMEPLKETEISTKLVKQEVGGGHTVGARQWYQSSEQGGGMAEVGGVRERDHKLDFLEVRRLRAKGVVTGTTDAVGGSEGPEIRPAESGAAGFSG